MIFPRSMFFMNDGILILTGHPSIQAGLAQSRQRLASFMAISKVKPWLTSSLRWLIRYSGASSGIVTHSISMRSFGFMVLRMSVRHFESLSISCSKVSSESSHFLVSFRLSAFVAWHGVFVVLLQRCSSKCRISFCSASLNVPIRFSISSQSTRAPSNSGPSMHTNFVFPPIERRQAPHIPVPSTIIVLSDTSVGILYFSVSLQQNFIIIGGPMAKTLSICSWLISFSIPMVITPFSPLEPSSVMIISLSLLSLTSSSRITRSLFLPAITERTRFPAVFSARIIGSIGAVPTPPPAQITVPNFSICVGEPSGPTTSSTESPTFRRQSFVEDSPTFCTTSVMEPSFVSESAMVRGMRSPFLSTLMMTKFPAFRLFAISGASILKRNTFSENCLFSIILFIFVRFRVKIMLILSSSLLGLWLYGFDLCYESI